MKRFITAFFIYSATVISLYAANFSVRGKVTDKNSQPLEFATFRVFSESDTVKPVVYGVTDINGSFNKELPSAGHYKARVTAVGQQEVIKEFEVTEAAPVADLGTLVCGEITKVLEGVMVTAQKPLVTKGIDRIGYDVQADIESKTSNLQEVLKKVPLVSVEPDGTIKVKGSSDFKIYKNGRPNNSFTKNAKEIFKAIPASMIKRIEVITDPGAREDAEGSSAILNIVTEQGLKLKGVMANLGINYNTASGLPSANLWGSGQIDKLTLSAYAGYNPFSKRDSRSSSISEGVYEDTGNRSFSSSRSSSKGNANWWGIDASYELDSLNLFTFEFGGYSYRVSSSSLSSMSLFDSADNLIYSYDQTSSTSPSRYLDFNGNLNYQHSTRRKGERVTLSYMISTTDQRDNSETLYSNQINMPVDYSGYLSDFKLRFMEHTFQADWTRPFGEMHLLDLGLKYIYRYNHSKTLQDYLSTDRSPMTDFTHNTSIAAAFADYRVSLKKVNLRAGLRYEFSRLSASYADNSNPDFASNLSDLVPNAAVSYNINDANTLKFSYSTRINRPGINYLNPAVSETPNSTSQGNPDLGSSRMNSLNLNYSFISRKFNLDFSSGYNFTDNAIIMVREVIGDHTYSGYANAGRNRSFNCSMFAQLMAGKKTTIMLNSGLNYNYYSNPSFNISKGGWNGYAFLRFSQKLPWKITGNFTTNYWGGNESLYSSMHPVGLIRRFYYAFSFNRNFLKEDRLTVRLDFREPFYPGSYVYKSESYNTSNKSVSYSYRKHYFSLGISVSYRIGSMSAQVKKTSASISNDDLVGRKN